MPRRGEVWWTRLDPTVGHEIRKTRPCLIVSPDEMNRSGMLVIVPLTSSDSRSFRVTTAVGGKAGAAAIDQVRSIDRARLGRCMGELDPITMFNVLMVLREMFND